MAALISALTASFNKEDVQAVTTSINNQFQTDQAHCGAKAVSVIKDIDIDITDCTVGNLDITNGTSVNAKCFIQQTLKNVAKALAKESTETKAAQAFGAANIEVNDINVNDIETNANLLQNQLQSHCHDSSWQTIKNVEIVETACQQGNLAIANKNDASAGCMMYSAGALQGIANGDITQSQYLGGFTIPTWAWIVVAVIVGLIVLLIVISIAKHASKAPSAPAPAAGGSGLNVAKLADLAELAA